MLQQKNLKQFFLIVGIISLFAGLIMVKFGAIDKVIAMSLVAIVMALWWIFEVLPLGITALLPLVAYPLLGIASTKQIAPIYMSSILLLFLGGFLVAIAMQKWNLHKRIAMTIISFFGSGPKKLVLGFMVATSFLSMWISNTASAVMMVSIGLAIIKNYEDIVGVNAASKAFAQALMISIAYSATIGGIATLVGTPPNLAFTRIYAMSFPEAPEISFANWILFGLPLSIVLVVIAWLLIGKVLMQKQNIVALDPKIIEDEKKKLGPMQYEEKWVFTIFCTMALAWIFRKDLNLGIFIVPGWSRLLPFGHYVDDGMVAIFMAMILFMIPARQKNKGRTLLNERAIKEIPWETILLFGGGFALAKGIQMSGLSTELGNQFSQLSDVHPGVIVGFVALGMSFITELTSNMASTEMILPILAAIAKSSNINPLSLMVPATLAASCAFMLPAATAPNAIIFGSNRIKIKDMVKVGFILNFISVLLIFLTSYYIVPKIL